MALKATRTSITKVLLFFSSYPDSVECDSQGVKMEFKTTTYLQSQETREDAFVSHSPHRAELSCPWEFTKTCLPLESKCKDYEDSRYIFEDNVK